MTISSPVGAADTLKQEAVRWIDVEGIRTRVYEDGSGQTLMLLHGGQFGMFSSLDSWSLNLPSLAESFQVVAIDKLGQGHTDNPKSDDDYTFEAMYDHMLAAIDALGLENIVLLGHSRGGLPAVRIAIERPRLVNKLIIVDSNTASPDPAMASNFNAEVAGEIPADLPVEEGYRRRIAANSYSLDHITDDYVARMVEIIELDKTKDALRRMEGLNESTWMPSLRQAREKTFDQIRQEALTMPTLIVWGYNSRSVPLNQGMQLLDLVAPATENVEMHILNRAGHVSFREQPEAFHRALRSFCLD